ncbi:PREDICTED: lymphocyte antigen 6K-like [Elephantulus edwardii]|uniref:lymphocyte antigen 6K-like n=1 Tax=Elephantulus edwardii TaxID=28737 RepID=UPI0003F0E70F|nr:PREDICTED: lymphocyte antigen 6K-like [Elephantulus edwardii]
MALLLALLLALSLPVAKLERSIYVSKQEVLKCHSCEAENNFKCLNPVNCSSAETYCITTAINLSSTEAGVPSGENYTYCCPVAGEIFARFYLVSKQCSLSCPVVERPAANLQPRRFLLEKPTPFLYIKCCEHTLCNEVGPTVNETTFRDLLWDASGQGTELATPLTLISICLGLGLS